MSGCKIVERKLGHYWTIILEIMLTGSEHPITKLAWRLYPKIKLHFLCDPSQKSLGSYSLDYTDKRFIEVVQTARRFIYAIHRLRTDTGTTAKLRSKAKIRKTDFIDIAHASKSMTVK